MNYSTARWTCAKLQRIWRLASDRKWGISHQNTRFHTVGTAHVSLLLSCAVLFSVLRSKAVGFPAISARSDRERSVFIVDSVQTGSSVLLTAATLNSAAFPSLSVCGAHAEDCAATEKKKQGTKQKQKKGLAQPCSLVVTPPWIHWIVSSV